MPSIAYSILLPSESGCRYVGWLLGSTMCLGYLNMFGQKLVAWKDTLLKLDLIP